MKSAQLFTLDTIFAVFTAATLSLVLLFYLSQASKPLDSDSGNMITMDALATLRASGALQRTVEQNSTAPLSTVLSSLPGQMCADIVIFDRLGTRIFSAAPAQCAAGQDYTIARTIFVARREIYIAQMRGWYR